MPTSYLTNTTFGAIPSDALIQRPAAIVGRSTAQTIAAGATGIAQVAFSTTAVFDNGSATLGTAMVAPSTSHTQPGGGAYANTGSGNGSIYIRRTGLYQVSWRCAWNVTTDNTGRRQSTIWKTTGGADSIVMRDDQVPLNTNSDVHVAVSTNAILTSGDEIWVSVYQSSGSNSSLLSTSGQPVELAVVFLGSTS